MSAGLVKIFAFAFVSERPSLQGLRDITTVAAGVNALVVRCRAQKSHWHFCARTRAVQTGGMSQAETVRVLRIRRATQPGTFFLTRSGDACIAWSRINTTDFGRYSVSCLKRLGREAECTVTWRRRCIALTFEQCQPCRSRSRRHRRTSLIKTCRTGSAAPACCSHATKCRHSATQREAHRIACFASKNP